MLSIEPTGAILGATVHGIDAREIDDEQFARILLALGRHGVLRFPDQQLDMGDLRRFSEQFGEIPDSFNGFVWVDDIWNLAPALFPGQDVRRRAEQDAGEAAVKARRAAR